LSIESFPMESARYAVTRDRSIKLDARIRLISPALRPMEDQSMVEGHTNCTCPLCCPDKWAINAAAVAQQEYAYSQTGLLSRGDRATPMEDTLARIELRLQRIEAILAAHFGHSGGSEHG
jgi:hypothetical protein